jgi:ParB family transcriptional regulator, chromosome partitioning protein
MNDEKTKTPALGKNVGHLALAELLGEHTSKQAHSVEKDQQSIAMASIDSIKNNPEQPRKQLNEESLLELSASIKQQGMLHPILVRQQADGYELIAGQRRLHAAKMAGLKSVPVLVKNIPFETAMSIALIENIQREDLNPIDLAGAYQTLMNKTNMTQQSLADVLGKPRSSISNTLRLLLLPKKIKQWTLDGKLSMGHAKALLVISDEESQLKLAKKAIENNLSVRQVEHLAKIKKASPASQSAVFNNTSTKKKAHAFYSKHIYSLSQKLSTPVQIKQDKEGKGSILIRFEQNIHLENLLQILLK